MHFFYKKHFRVSVLFDWLMQIAAYFFTLLKKNKANAIEYKIAGIALYSKNENLKERLEQQLQKKLVWHTEIERNTLISQTESGNVKTEILLDNNGFSFKQIIAFLEENKNKGFLFKIIPSRSSFLIGSNSSNDKGKVVPID
jgi:tRNA A37 N6-isopentenylltransferase MiaA